MQFLSLQPFVPSGADFEKAKAFFRELGFTLLWESGGYAGLQKDQCGFILQHMDNKSFAENFMLTVNIPDAHAFWKEMEEKHLAEKFGIRMNKPVQQPYGLEVNIIDPAGVCWHFVQ